MTLTEFLLTRIAEDEAVARAALYDDADAANQPHSLSCGYRATELSVTPECICGWPVRVLAECAAKRAIVEACESSLANLDGPGAAGLAYCTLEALALPFADHPDYDESWKP